MSRGYKLPGRVGGGAGVYDTSTGRWDRGAGLVLATLLGVSVGMIGGIGYARRYLLPAEQRATVDDGRGERVAVLTANPESSTTHFVEPTLPGTPALARAPEPVIEQPPAARASRAVDPSAAPPEAGPARDVVSPSTRQVASMLEEATTRPFELSRDRRLFTCPEASHLSSTTTQAGHCADCGKRLVSARTVPHGLQAMLAFGRQSRKPAAMPVVSIRPVRKGRVLYACRRPEHVAATTNGPGACSLCGAELAPATTLSHALDIMRYQAAKERPGSETKPTTSRPALYTCLVRDHVAVTTDKPGLCESCQLTLLPVERVGHTARAIDAWELGRRAVNPGVERPEPSLPELYTCPDVQHVESTGRRPGACPVCGLALRSVYAVVHQVDAIRAYAKARAERKARTATSRPTTTVFAP